MEQTIPQCALLMGRTKILTKIGVHPIQMQDYNSFTIRGYIQALQAITNGHVVLNNG